MKHSSRTKALRCDKLLLLFRHSHRVFSQTAFWFVGLPFDGLLPSNSYGWPCVLSQHHPDCTDTDTDTKWQTHCVCLWLCVCLLMCDNANITLAMTSPGMSLSGYTRHSTLLRRQTGLIRADRAREHRTAAFYCCHSNAIPFLSPSPSNSQFPNLWFMVWERERAKKALILCCIYSVDWMQCWWCLGCFSHSSSSACIHAEMGLIFTAPLEAHKELIKHVRLWLDDYCCLSDSELHLCSAVC